MAATEAVRHDRFELIVVILLPLFISPEEVRLRRTLHYIRRAKAASAISSVVCFSRESVMLACRSGVAE